MLKLKELQFSGIGRFVEEQKISFSNLSNLVQVDGQNNNTNGSSGSGKTTIFNALDYLFGLNDVPNTVLQSRLTKDGISVTGLFDLDGQNLKISRIKGKLAVDLDGDLITGSSKLSEERLDQILAMPRHLFRPLYHKRQKEGGFFLQFSPKDMNEFLTDCLGLGDYRLKLDIIEKKLKEASERKILLEKTIYGFQNSLKSTQDAIVALGSPPTKEVGQEAILQLKAKYEASSLALQQIEHDHLSVNAELDKKRPDLSSEPFDTSTKENAQREQNIIQNAIYDAQTEEKARQNKASSQLAEYKLKLSQLSNIAIKGTESHEQATKIAGEIKKLRENICPTCEQNWVTDTIKIREVQLVDQISLLKEKINAGVTAQLNMSAANALIYDLTPQTAARPVEGLDALEARRKELEIIVLSESARERDFLNAQIQANKVKQDEWAASQRFVREKQSAEATQARGQVDMDRRLFEAAVSKLKQYSEAAARYESTWRTLKNQEIANFDVIAGYENEYEKIGKDVSMFEELKRAVKSYVSCSFDDALEAIGDTATRIIRNIPNMANATLQLEGTKETKEGKVKEEVNALISVDGDIGVPIKSLSGGERSAVDLAVDLAVVDLIENKTGKGIDLMILDEPFTGLDAISIEMTLEILKNSNINKRLIIVDHNDSVKEMVGDRLIVVRDGTISKLLQ